MANDASARGSLPTRRDLLTGAGAALTYGSLASAFGALLPAGVRAAESAAGTDCMTILYPSGEGLKFDADYYRDKHLKTIMRLYGRSISRFELRKVNMPAPPGSAPGSMPAQRYAAAVNIWIANLAAFNANNEKHSATLIADVPNFTNTQPVIQFDKIHGQMGAARSAMKVGDTCLTILYPNSADVRWDVDYYRTGHMPLIMRLYGPDAIKRFELRKGDAGQAAGSKPAFIGSVNIYIKDQKAFDTAGQEHGPTLVKDVPNFSSVSPNAFPTVIYSVA